MILISTTTEQKKNVLDCINSIDRLSELVEVSSDINTKTGNQCIVIEGTRIFAKLDWHDNRIPFILPEVDFSSNHLLAFVFYLLGNNQRAFEYLTDEDELHKHFLIATQIQFGYVTDIKDIEVVERKSLHNAAIAYNFGKFEVAIGKKKIQDSYENAIREAKNDEFSCYTIKHYVNFLLDMGLAVDAEKLIRPTLLLKSSDAAKNALQVTLSRTMIAQVRMPYKKEALTEILGLLLGTIHFYEANNLIVNAGLQLISASEIASYQNNMTFSKELIEKAIVYFREANVPEFLGEAVLQKAILLYTWSKNGTPGFYKPSINAFQDCLKVFKRDTHPQKFAEIQHNLGLLYSEVPVSSEEKAIWTAFCASAFKEALNYYTKEEHPYEFAMVSHNYASAMMNFPDAKLHNNITKAIGMFDEALSVRTAERYPFERALTLLNQLEFYWLAHNKNMDDEKNTMDTMVRKANEVKKLSKDLDLVEKANKHLAEIENLKQLIK